MKGIMRKRLAALLSMAGLAGSVAPVTAQVLKGSEPGDKTKAESTMKYGKATQENAAAKDVVNEKARKAGGEQKAAQDVVNEKIGPDASKNAAGHKMRKAGGEQNAITVKQKVVEHSVGERNAANKQLDDKRKLTKAEQENAAAAAQFKGKKNAAEANAGKQDASKKVLVGLSEPQKSGQSEATVKLHKAKTENSATGSSLADKSSKANGQMGDGSVRTAATGSSGTGKGSAKGGAGSGKVAVHDIHIKGEKSAAETNAVQQDAQKKADKATPK